jgi:hypothetical protein
MFAGYDAMGYVLEYHLVMFAGYDAMGYEMSKPHLRAELEADLKRCV